MDGLVHLLKLLFNLFLFTEENLDFAELYVVELGQSFHLFSLVPCSLLEHLSGSHLVLETGLETGYFVSI